MSYLIKYTHKKEQLLSSIKQTSTYEKLESFCAAPQTLQHMQFEQNWALSFSTPPVQ